MPELLLELLSEEIPARMQDRAAVELGELVTGLLAEAGIAFERPVSRFATPRRLTLVVNDVAPRQPDRTVERKGPRADAPEAARSGFLRSLEGQPFRLEEREEKKARTIFALIEERGRATPTLLAERLPDLLARFSWPKSMRWGTDDARWVRPLQSILCLFDRAVVPFAFAGVKSGAETSGHRFMAPRRLTVHSFADYAAALRAGKVVLDGEARRRIVRERAEGLAAKRGLRLRADEPLLDEIKGLVEWPVPLLGSIEASFMDLPPEVLVTVMREHQRYLALEDEAGRLAPHFVAVANIEADDGGAAIIAGNERVLRARLWDARFFWEQDRAKPLESLLPKLDRAVFHDKLGTQGQRVARLVELVEAVTLMILGKEQSLPPPERFRMVAIARRAARLAKADLVTGMVGEFPELQGIVGGHIARAQGLPADVALAMADQYLPKGPDDPFPTAPVSVAVALADRIDTLVGFFGCGFRPTGSKDPFALRRAALGVVRITLENRLNLPLRDAFGLAIGGYRRQRTDFGSPTLIGELLAFFADRLHVHLRGQGVRHDLIAAVFAAGAGRNDDLAILRDRANALQAFLGTEDGINLLAGYRRASNIVAIEERKDGRTYQDAPNPDESVENEERTLFNAIELVQSRIAADLGAERFGAAMAALAELRPPIDAFFERVMVNVADPALRANRLRLLNRIRAALGGVADFSKIEDIKPSGQ